MRNVAVASCPRSGPKTRNLRAGLARNGCGKSEGKLLADRIAKLDTLNFEWRPGRDEGGGALSGEQYFEIMFRALLQYKLTHGDCLVPQRWKDKPRTRRLGDCATNGLPPRAASARLRSATRRTGLRVDPIGTRWRVCFNSLPSSRETMGTRMCLRARPDMQGWLRGCGINALRRNETGPLWLCGQNGSTSLVFAWRLVERNAWERMLDRLIEFRKIHGHCNVPQKGGESERLGKWVNTRRTHFKRGTRIPEQGSTARTSWLCLEHQGESRSFEVAGGLICASLAACTMPCRLRRSSG